MTTPPRPPEGDDDEFRGGALRGLMFAIPLALLLWVPIIWGIIALVGLFH